MNKPHPIRGIFRRVADGTARHLGSPWTFLSAIVLIFLWAGSGFFLGFDQTWQLLINTGTTIATFLMVILVQHTQYREGRSMQLKLDELLLGTKNTRDFFLEVEDETDEELETLKQEFHRLRKKYVEHIKKHHKKLDDHL